MNSKLDENEIKAFLDQRDEIKRLEKEEIEKRCDLEFQIAKRKKMMDMALKLPSIYELILLHTENGQFIWSCGSHSDIWSGKHKNYTVTKSDGIFARYLILDFPTDQRFEQKISYFQWRKIHKAILAKKEISEVEAVLSMNPFL